MLCSNVCLRGIKCEPLSNIHPDDKTSYVCVGLHQDKKANEYVEDIYRHCFKTEETDTMNDYDRYDIISVINVLSEALLHDELINNAEESYKKKYGK